MLLSEGLLAMGLLLGQPASGQTTLPVWGDDIKQVQQTVPAPPVLQPQPTQRPILGFFRTEERPILSKIQGWWKRDDQPVSQPRGPNIRETPAPTPPNPAPVQPAPGVNDYYRRMPNPTSKATTPSDPVAKEKKPAQDVQAASLQEVVTPKFKSPILPALADKIGRDDKFEWITGQFEIENGNSVLYYATPETVDKYHGRIVLAAEQTDLKQYRHGDLLSVRGTVSQRQTTQGIVPIYHVTMASLIERPKQ